MARIRESISAAVRDGYQLSTWLGLAALTQCVILQFVPFQAAILPSLILVGFRLFYRILASANFLDDGSLEGVRFGRWTTKVPSADGQLSEKPSANPVTVLMLSARTHHPLGVLAPNFMDVVNNMQGLMAELDENPEKWGFEGRVFTPEPFSNLASLAVLGRTPTLVSSEAPASNTVVWFLYWKSAADLHSFANSGKHAAIMRWYNDKAKAPKFHIGVAHEVYEVPAGNWETIYVNMRPFGLGNALYPVSKAAGENRSIEVLQPAQGAVWERMYSRLGRPEPGRPKDNEQDKV